MSRLLILILLCSCSTTFKVNGVDIKQKTRVVQQNQRIEVVGYGLILTGIYGLYLPIKSF